MTSNIQLIHGLTRAELTHACKEMGLPAYRADQVQRWLHVQGVTDWSEMKNVPLSERKVLAEKFSLDSAVLVETSGSEGKTRKILVGLRDGERVEEVLIPSSRWRTVCISSQVGCRHRCAFCASGQGGYQRDLEAGEMVGQVLLAARDYGDKSKQLGNCVDRLTSRQPRRANDSGGSCSNLTHVVVMGIGEPFDNYDAVLKAVRIINDKKGLGIGARRITISTCGIIPGIKRLSDEGIQVELSVSLHAVDDALRTKLMPVNREYPLPDLLQACRDYTRKTKRIVTFEYVLVRGVNDQPSHADDLARMLKRQPCRVNLIPLSPVEEYDGAMSGSGPGRMFINTLKKAGINATLRASRGNRVKAACGQLRQSRS